jgi:energy-coupling factor transporter ATP-binding protein EcfA2
MEPDLLMLDEPTNHLDLISLLWLQRYLLNYSGAILMISHDRDFMDSLVESVVGIDPDAVALKVYCSDPDGSDLFWVQDAPVGPLTIVQAEKSTALCKNLGYDPPPAGELVAAHNGRMLVVQGADLYFSMALYPHLFRPDLDHQRFPGAILMIAPQIDGFYLATDEPKVYWIEGSEPSNWRRRVVGMEQCAFGDAKLVEGHKHLWLEFSGLVPVWVTEHGLAYGLPSGQVRYPTSGRTAIDAHKGASVAFREQAGLRQLLVGLRARTDTNRLGVSDQFVAERIPGSGP